MLWGKGSNQFKAAKKKKRKKNEKTCAEASILFFFFFLTSFLTFRLWVLNILPKGNNKPCNWKREKQVINYYLTERGEHTGVSVSNFQEMDARKRTLIQRGRRFSHTLLFSGKKNVYIKAAKQIIESKARRVSQESTLQRAHTAKRTGKRLTASFP